MKDLQVLIVDKATGEVLDEHTSADVQKVIMEDEADGAWEGQDDTLAMCVLDSLAYNVSEAIKFEGRREAEAKPEAPDTFESAFASMTVNYSQVNLGVACRACVECADEFHALTAPPDCDEYHDGHEEFTSRQCDTCGTYLAGSREIAHGQDKSNGQWDHLSVCIDCAMYIANGDVPESWRASATQDDIPADEDLPSLLRTQAD